MLYFNLIISRKKNILIATVLVLITYNVIRKTQPALLHPHNYFDFLVAAAFLYLSKDLNQRSKNLVSASLIFATFLIQAFWTIYKTPASLFDIYAIKDVFDYSVIISVFLATLILFIFLSSLFVLFKIVQKKTFWIASTLIVCISFMLPPPSNWSPTLTFKARGIAVSFAEEIISEGKKILPGADQSHLFYLASNVEIIQKRNINILILESLVVPQYLDVLKDKTDLKLDLPWQKMIAPTFGGQSARSEFEILCGIPSFKKPFVEFNSIRRKMECLPNILKRAGYHTIVSNAGKPTTFNARRAYAYLGFETQNWYSPLQPSKTKINWINDYLMFDGSILQENLAQISFYRKPYLNYIVGAYGHAPYDDDLIQRPLKYKAENKTLERILNIQFYREKEVTRWLSELNRIDPDSINIVCGDHLPFIQGIDFEKQTYTNFCHSNIKIPESNLYKITVQILNELGCKKCEIPKNLEEQYSYLLF